MNRFTRTATLLAVGLLASGWGSTGCRDQAIEEDSATAAIRLTPDHRRAIQRQRRLMLHYDYTSATARNTPWGKKEVDQLDEVIREYMAPYDDPNTRFVDTLVYELGEGYPAMWASNIVPRAKVVFPKWWEAGIDPLEVLVRETKGRQREVFLTYRINGSDVEEDAEFADWQLSAMKREHPEWLIEVPWGLYVWNFAFQEVRDYKLRVLREVAEMYDVDGLQIDFARIPVLFPAGTQWENRDHLTAFMRELRLTLLEVERQRGRPFLLAVRIPENLMGCHFDGLEVERWVREGLVDLLVPGCGAAEVDIAGYRRLVAETPVRVYPSWDPIHPNDGYRQPPIEYWRGLYSRWWAQGADGVHIFNITPEDTVVGSPPGGRLGEIADPEGMRYRDKVFFVERRSGSHGREVTGDPYQWETPRHMFFMTYMTAPLPALVSAGDPADLLLKLTVTDDISSAGDRIEALLLRLLLSDPEAGKVRNQQRLKPARLWTYPGHEAVNEPPVQGIEKGIEVRLNNLLLENASTDDGWLTFPVRARQVAPGDNLIGIRLKHVSEGSGGKIRVEKVELHLHYREAQSADESGNAGGGR